MDALERLELKTELLREIDRLRAEKADRGDITVMATELSRTQLDQAERNRAIRDSVADIERALKGLAQLVASEPVSQRGGRFSLREIDPRVLIVAALAGGAAGGKALEFILSGM